MTTKSGSSLKYGEVKLIKKLNNYDLVITGSLMSN